MFCKLISSVLLVCAMTLAGHAMDYNVPPKDPCIGESPETPPFRYNFNAYPYGESSTGNANFYCYKPREQPRNRPGIIIAGAYKTQDDQGNAIYQEVALPDGWVVGGHVHRDLGNYCQPSPASLPGVGWRTGDSVNYVGKDVFYHYPLSSTGKTRFKLWTGIERYMSQYTPLETSGPEGTAANSGWLADAVGTKHWNERGRIKTPVCKDEAGSVDDYVDLTNVTINHLRLKYMGSYLRREKVIATNLAGTALGGGSSWIGETDSQGNIVLGFKNTVSAVRLGISNRTTLSTQVLDLQYAVPTPAQIRATIKSDYVYNTGLPRDVIVIENALPKITNVGLGQYSNEYVYSEISFDSLGSTPGHSHYVVWSFNDAGQGITRYETTDQIGAALIPNGGTGDIMIVAHDIQGNIYAYNNIVFPAPYWPQARTAERAKEKNGIIDLAGGEVHGTTTTTLDADLLETAPQSLNNVEKLHEIRKQDNQICEPCLENELK